MCICLCDIVYKRKIVDSLLLHHLFSLLSQVGKASEVVTDTLFELYLSTSSSSSSPLPPPPLSLAHSSHHSASHTPTPSHAPPHLSPPEDGRIVSALNRARDCDFTSLDVSVHLHTHTYTFTHTDALTHAHIYKRCLQVLMERKRKAQRLLENAAIKYDPENLLMLSRSHNFQEGERI